MSAEDEGATAAPVELPPRYYHSNFLELADTVLERYSDLLTGDEHAFLDGLTSSLSIEAQCLYLRMVSRVGPWFRVSRLHYTEIGATEGPLNELLASGYARVAEALGPAELGALFTVAELRSLFRDELSVTACKSDLLDCLAELYPDGGDLLRCVCEQDNELIVAPCGAESFVLLQLLFFGNLHQSLTDFVLSDLGVQQYFPYELDASARKFSCREAVLEYLHIAELREHWYQLLDQDDLAGRLSLVDALIEWQPRFDSSHSRWSRLLNRAGRDMERQGQPDRALALYRGSREHPARERSARVLEAAAEHVAALECCASIQSQPWCEEELQAATRISARIKRRQGGAPVRRRRPQYKELQLSLAAGGRRVEHSTAEHLAANWQSVHYVENTLMNGLFGLAFWELIFAPVAGTFQHRFQRGPDDMYSAEFSRRRESMLEQRRAELASCDLAQELLQAYDRFSGYQNQWVHWSALTRELVQRAVLRIPRAHLLGVWERLLFDPRSNRKGFPDLIAFNEHPGDYCLIEVKGPGDQLQDSQKRWLQHFVDSDMPAAVAWVSFTDD